MEGWIELIDMFAERRVKNSATSTFFVLEFAAQCKILTKMRKTIC